MRHPLQYVPATYRCSSVHPGVARVSTMSDMVLEWPLWGCSACSIQHVSVPCRIQYISWSRLCMWQSLQGCTACGAYFGYSEAVLHTAPALAAPWMCAGSHMERTCSRACNMIPEQPKQGPCCMQGHPVCPHAACRSTGDQMVGLCGPDLAYSPYL